MMRGVRRKCKTTAGTLKPTKKLQHGTAQHENDCSEITSLTTKMIKAHIDAQSLHVTAFAQSHIKPHDDAFPQRVDRRVGHL
jgi:hypothetical protein